MTHTDPTPGQPLALLGGAGLRPAATPLWAHLKARAPDSFAHVAIIPAALANQKVGTPQRRASLTAAALEPHAAHIDIVPILSREDAARPALIDRIAPAGAIILIAGEPRVLSDTLSATPAWEAIVNRHRQGALLIAAGGAAAALCQTAVAPLQPFPAAVDFLQFAAFEGLGLLPGMTILPYFSWLSDQVLRAVRTTIDVTTQVGIDDQAALLAGPAGWSVQGLGSVSISPPTGQRHMIDAQFPVPEGLLPPYPVR